MSVQRVTDAQVLAALEPYLASADQADRDVTIAAFATHVGLKRPTLYSRFPDIVDTLAARKVKRATQTRDKGTGRTKTLEDERLQARRAERDALRQVRVLANQVRVLTLENAHLRAQLEAQQGIAPLKPRQPHG